MTKSWGACRLAATVCPRSTEREMTTPSIGARIVVCSRSTFAASSAARACLRSAWRCCRATTAASRSACEAYCLSNSSCARFWARCPSVTDASARATAASACTSRARNDDGSSWQMIWPVRTLEL